jgi:hypothetical protein
LSSHDSPRVTLDRDRSSDGHGRAELMSPPMSRRDWVARVSVTPMSGGVNVLQGVHLYIASARMCQDDGRLRKEFLRRPQ